MTRFRQEPRAYRRIRARLDRPVTFMAKGEGRDSFNAPTEDWIDSFSTLCRMLPSPGTEKYANAENIATAPILIEVRAEDRTLSLTPDHAARIAGKVYEIVSLEQPERGANIQISAVYNGASNG